MDCCSINGLPKVFGGSTPRKEAEAFRKKGLPKRTRPIVDFLQSAEIEGASVLDIGFGVGSLHLELLRSGAGAVVGVEVVDTYVGEAERLASELGFADAVDYQLADFTRIQSDIEAADIVVLDRSICCYPDMPGLVKPSAEHARRFYAIVLPVEKHRFAPDHWIGKCCIAACAARVPRLHPPSGGNRRNSGGRGAASSLL